MTHPEPFKFLIWKNNKQCLPTANYLIMLILFKTNQGYTTNQQTKWFKPKFSEATDFLSTVDTEMNVNIQEAF